MTFTWEKTPSRLPTERQIGKRIAQHVSAKHQYWLPIEFTLSVASRPLSWQISRGRNIAQIFGISKAHLMKVVNDLSRKGYLDTVRGRNGSVRRRLSKRMAYRITIKSGVGRHVSRQRRRSIPRRTQGEAACLPRLFARSLSSITPLLPRRMTRTARPESRTQYT